MISHKHKCIFIHIAKCAGTSVEYSFGVDINNLFPGGNNHLFGWDKKNKLWLQHATPQQLLDLNLIKASKWDSYYKFIIYRNSWDKAYSDYIWMKKIHNIEDKFENYINRSGKFEKVLNNSSESYYSGDHLIPQKEYFFLNGFKIDYDVEIDFSEIDTGFSKVESDVGLPKDFFQEKLNKSGNNKLSHYSKFYNRYKKKLVSDKYQEDIEFFNFKFEQEITPWLKL